MRALGVLATVALLAGCFGSTSDGWDPATASNVCKKQHVEQEAQGPLLVCDELFDDAPNVRLPDPGAGLVFAAVDSTDFVTPERKRYAVPEAVQDSDEGRRQAFVVYVLEVSRDKVVSHRPAIKFQESVFVDPLLGKVAQGKISARDAEGGFEYSPSLPVRIDLHAQPAAQPWSEGQYEMVASIANLDEAVTGSDGTCLPALASAGDAAPFPSGASVELRGYRVPSMHGFGDNEFVFELRVDGEPAGSMMARGWYLGPADFILGTGPGEYEGIGHGAPGSIPTLQLELVSGGGGPCAST